MFNIFLALQATTPSQSVPFEFKSVTAAEFTQKLAKAAMVLVNATGGIIVPFATLGFVICVLLFIIGSAVHSKTLKQMSALGLASIAGGVLIYFAIPLIMGLLQSMSSAFK